MHRHFLKTYSPVFALMFGLPSSGGETNISAEPVADGQSDNVPIPLPGVTVLEFESLLKVFYRRCVPWPSPTLRWPSDATYTVPSRRSPFPRPAGAPCSQ